MRLSVTLLGGVAAVAICAGASPSHAAPADRVDSQVDELIVTGRAGALDRRRVEASFAVTTLDDAALRLQAPMSTAEVFKAIPGFWVEASGGEASNNVRTRGIPTDGYSSVTIQEDGLTIQHDGGLGWLNADQSFRLDETIGRVEAVRGGPASIFASNSPGGTVNFITRKAGETAEGLVKATVGDYGMYRADFWYGAPLGDGWGLTLGGFYRSDEGVRSPGFTQNRGGQVRIGLSKAFETGRLDVNIKHISDNVGFLLPVPLTFDNKQEPKGVPGFDASYGTLAGPDNRQVSFRNVGGPFAFDLDRGTDVSLTAITIRLDLEVVAGWRLQNTGRYRTSDIVRNGLFPTGSIETATGRLNGLRNAALAAFPGAVDVQYRYATSGAAFDPVTANRNGLVVSGNLLSVSVPLDEFTTDLRLVRMFEIAGQTHDIAVGAYVSDYSYDYDRYMATSNLEVRDQARRLDIVAVNAAGGNVGRVTENGILRYGSLFDNAAIDAQVVAFYASDEWQVTPQLRIDAGVRQERIEFSGSVEGKQTVDLGVAGTLADNQVITGTGVFTRIDRAYSGLSWTLGANYQLEDRLGVFARYTDTVRLPAPSEFQGSPGDALRTDIKTTPVQMIEAGLKWRTDVFDLYATAFQTRFENIRFSDDVFNSATNSFTTRVAYGSTRTSGVEIEGLLKLMEGWDVAGAVSWQNPEYDSFRFTENVGGVPTVRNFGGNQLIRVPRLGLRLVPAVNFLEGAVRIELPVEHYSKRYADVANSQSLTDYTVINLNARWNVSDRMAVSLAGVNLTNVIGLTEGNPRAGQFVSGDAGARYYLARPILGTSWRAALTYRF
ncbi:MAG: TonB-dependent receptor [Phenylobacterium sp.]|nr:TonB-dependent receptor [Phenylobacterium sp.]